MTISPADFDYVRNYIKSKSAITLEAGKEYLVESRLSSLLSGENCKDITELVARLREKPESPLHAKVLDAMTTNETFFFRDITPFEAFKKEVIPDLLSRRSPGGPLNIWCAASSSGQEPYTIAMCIADSFPLLKAPGALTLIASDISQQMLTKAKAGLYTQLEVNRGLPAALLVKYFTKIGLDWQIKDEIRKMVDYRMLNLSTTFPTMPAMDIVFIRNVLIYFEVEVKKKILEQIRKILKPDGYLFLGGSETTFNLDDNFERCDLNKTVAYRLKK